MTVLEELSTEDLRDKYENATEDERMRALAELYTKVKVKAEQVEVAHTSMGNCWTYKLTISNGRKRTVKSFTDSVHNYNTGATSSHAEMLYCLCSDARAYYYHDTLDDFCSNFGYDEQTGAKILKECHKTYDDLVRVFGSEYDFERVNAIFESM